MTSINVATRENKTLTIDAEPGVSIMSLIRDSGIDELLALCGGCRSCATCHVYVDDHYAKFIPPMGVDEDELLESSSHRTANSRLSCQVQFTESLDGMTVRIAPED